MLQVLDMISKSILHVCVFGDAFHIARWCTAPQTVQNIFHIDVELIHFLEQYLSHPDALRFPLPEITLTEFRLLHYAQTLNFSSLLTCCE